MLPSIRNLVDVERLRDGGSLAATYSDGRQDAVLFMKLIVSIGDDGKWQIASFDQPFILGGGPVQWRRSINWSETREALTLMVQLSGDLGPDARRHLTMMAKIADLDGSLPPDFDSLL